MVFRCYTAPKSCSAAIRHAGVLSTSVSRVDTTNKNAIFGKHISATFSAFKTCPRPRFVEQSLLFSSVNVHIQNNFLPIHLNDRGTTRESAYEHIVAVSLSTREPTPAAPTPPPTIYPPVPFPRTRLAHLFETRITSKTLEMCRRAERSCAVGWWTIERVNVFEICIQDHTKDHNGAECQGYSAADETGSALIAHRWMVKR